jgi:hypothetical protein
MRNMLKTIDTSKTAVTIRIGNGVPVHRQLLETLDATLPAEVKLEVVSEAGTNHRSREAKHPRGFRHIASAMHIAGRVGHAHMRRKSHEQNG